jgi:hypothetical protein
VAVTPLQRGLKALLELRKALGKPLVQGRVQTDGRDGTAAGVTQTVRRGFFPDLAEGRR